MTRRYFFYDPNEGLEWFTTEEACLKAAREQIDAYCPTDGDYWPTEDVEALRMGIVTHVPQQTNLRARTEEDEATGLIDGVLDWRHIDYLCNYEMLPVPGVRGEGQS